MTRIAILAAICLGLAAPAIAASPQKVAPKPTPAAFATPSFGLTFRSPLGSTYCPLPDDFQGSDHGTLVFLTPPQFCSGQGYPSNSRGFFPQSTPLIQVYYQYWMGEDGPKPTPCRPIGRVMFLGHLHYLCQVVSPGVVNVSIQGRYMADQEAEAVFTLITPPKRLQRDLITFKTMLKTVRPCAADWKMSGKPDFVIGTGRPCPTTNDDF